MKKSLAVTVAVVLALTVSASRAEAKSAKEIVAKIEELYKKVQDYKAKFSQTVIYTALGKSSTNTGMVFFKKPRKMRWEYDPPKSQLFVIDGKNVWFYMPSENQVLVESVDKAFSTKTPLSLLSGAAKLSKHFKVKLTDKFKEKAHGITLELEPYEKIPEVKQIVIAVDEKSYIITDTFIVDKFGNVTHILLSDIKMNIGLPDELFTFTPPKGAQVFTPSEVLKKK